MEFQFEEKVFYDVATEWLGRVMSLISLVFALPIIFLIAIAIKLEDGGPVLYRQRRVGKNGELFTLYKLRSMVVNDERSEFVETHVDDPRVTKVGKFIRKTRLDELPQLLNVLRGDMKLIGPRPLVPEEVEEILKELSEFVNRQVILPGLTGLAQVNGGNDLTPAEKLALDMGYVKGRGIAMDVKILIKTVGIVWSGDGAR